MRNQSGVYWARNRPKRTLPQPGTELGSPESQADTTIELRACPQLKGCESEYLLFWATTTIFTVFANIPSLVKERNGNEEFVKKVHLSSVEGPNRRGRPLVRWEDRVKKYVSEREMRGNGLEWARREHMDRERQRSVCRGHPPLGTLPELLID